MAHIARSLLPNFEKQYGLRMKTLNKQVHAMIRCLACPDTHWDLGLYLTTDEHMRRLNKRYRQQNKPTDILSFPAHKITKPGRFPRVYTSDKRFLGDIFISLPYVKHYCEKEGGNAFKLYIDANIMKMYIDIDLAHHMPVLLAHGLCHLLGYDHEHDEEYEKMAKAEAYLLRHYKKLL